MACTLLPLQSGSRPSCRSTRSSPVYAAIATLLLCAGKSSAQVQLQGGGSTVAAPFIMSAIANATAAAHAAGQNISITYTQSTSTFGAMGELSGKIDFGTSVAPFNSTQYSAEHAQIPFATGVFSVATAAVGIRNFSLDAPTLAAIYTCKLRTWEQVSVAVGVDLNMTGNITPIGRAESSGVTYLLTIYLATAGSIQWPLGTNATSAIGWFPCVETAVGSPEIVDLIKATPGSIGYLEYSAAQAAGFTSAQLLSLAGAFASPSSTGYSALDAQSIPSSVTSPAWSKFNLSTADYPFTGLEYFFAPVDLSMLRDRGDDSRQLLQQFILYLLSDEAQEATLATGLGPLPSEIRDVAVAGANALTGAGSDNDFGLMGSLAPTPSAQSPAMQTTVTPVTGR